MKLAIITVNYHNPDETVACLQSFNDLSKGKTQLSFYVVDNGGSSESSKYLSKKLPKAQIITSIKNLGFAGGSNLAIKEALLDGANSVLLINPDTIIETKDFLLEMLETKVDIAAPLIKYRANNQITYDYGGKVDYVFGRNTHLTSHLKHSTENCPDYFTGACLLIKTAVFEKIGLLDEGYFLYYEDADFCLRAVKAGFTQKLCPKAIIFHSLSTATSKIGKKKISIIASSHLRFCRKHLPIIASPLFLFFNLYLRGKYLFTP